MEVQFADSSLERLETDASFTGGRDRAIVRAFRMRMQAIRAAKDLRDLYVFRSWRLKKLGGNRSHQRSIRLNDQWRLIVEVMDDTTPNGMRIMAIEDYH